ncbi:MAG: glycosyltransferase [Candidatus Electrothrix sp. AW3_4]|nr:glycosyltransferase [Candidatus Electrothrix gigas]
MSIGIVVIGRNEGERLRRCLESLPGSIEHVVYVDSGSTDDSVETACSMGAEVVALDVTVPFTAARARNAGFARLRELTVDLQYVQFIDGDCELNEDWLLHAADFLTAHPDVAIVCGRLRERYPHDSIYNMLCDIEWDTPIGEAKACGGIAMIRSIAFEEVDGFMSRLIAGEEPELCIRLRQVGWKIWRIDAEMALHHAEMKKFFQWWKRSVRTGYTFAEGAYLYGSLSERYNVKQSRSSWIWAVVIPLSVLFTFLGIGSCGLLLLAIYPAQVLRLTLRGHRTRRENYLYALFLVLGKFPQLLGQIKFYLCQYQRSNPQLIEYK